MAMDKAGMAQAIMDKQQAVTDGIDWENGELPGSTDYNDAFDEGLKEYLEDNLEITYSWAATLPPPASTPDPVTSFKAHVTYPLFSIDQPANLAAWGTMVITAIAGATIEPIIEEEPEEPDTAVPPFIFTPGSLKFLPAAPLVITPSNADNQKDALEHVCNLIITAIKLLINPTPVLGTHSPYTVPAPGAIMTLIQ